MRGACGLAVAWLATTHANGAVDASVRPHYATSPLTAALSEASASIGIRVPVTEIAGAPPATERPGGGPADSRSPASAGALRPLPDSAVATPPPPTAQELAGDSLYQFVIHHATVHYVNTGARGNLAHWRGGRSGTVCPTTLGLDPASNAFVTARIRAVAESVGAPVQPDLACHDNVRVFFTAEPQRIMADVLKWAPDYLRVRYPDMRRLMVFKSGPAVQGWYFTTPGGGNILNSDVALLRTLHVWPLWPQVIPKGGTNDDDTSAIVSVILVVDTTKVAGYGLGTIADYVAQLALSVVQSPDHCDPLPSILDAMAPSCAGRDRPAAITAGDLAFLKALYLRNTGLGSSLTRFEIQDYMARQFRGL